MTMIYFCVALVIVVTCEGLMLLERIDKNTEDAVNKAIKKFEDNMRD